MTQCCNRYFSHCFLSLIEFFFLWKRFCYKLFLNLNSLYSIILSFPQYNLLNALSQPLKSINSKALHYLCNLFCYLFQYKYSVLLCVHIFEKKTEQMIYNFTVNLIFHYNLSSTVGKALCWKGV